MLAISAGLMPLKGQNGVPPLGECVRGLEDNEVAPIAAGGPHLAARCGK